MEIKCFDITGMGWYLTKYKIYDVLEETEYSYIIKDDMGSIAKYSKSRFEIFGQFKKKSNF